METIKLTIKSARLSPKDKDKIQFLFRNGNNIPEGIRTQTYDLQVTIRDLAYLMMESDTAHYVIDGGYDSLEDLETEWEIEGQEYKLKRIWDDRERSDFKTSEFNFPENMPEGLKRILNEIKDGDVKPLFQGEIKRDKVGKYEYDQIVGGDEGVSVGTLNDKGRDGWIVADTFWKEGVIKSVLMMRKLKK